MEGRLRIRGYLQLKPDAPDADDDVRTLSSFYVPVFEEMLADGTIVEYEIDREMMFTTDSRPQLHFSFVMPSAEGLPQYLSYGTSVQSFFGLTTDIALLTPNTMS